jgi:hypothetical protein
MSKLNTEKLILATMEATGFTRKQVEDKLSGFYASESESDSDSESDYDSDGSIDLENMSLEELKNECEFVGVPSTGTKAQIRERLWAWDDENVQGSKTTAITTVQKPYEPRAKPKKKKPAAAPKKKKPAAAPKKKAQVSS